MHLNQPPHDRKANSQPSLRPSQVAVNLREHLEDVREHVRRDADSVVRDRDDRFASHQLHSQSHSAPTLCELGGVVQQVREHLSQSGQVSVYIDWAGRDFNQ